MSGLFDTHAHLADEKLLTTINSVIVDSQNAGVSKILSIGCSLEEIEKSIELAERYPQFIHTSAGIYPHINSPNEPEIAVLLSKLESYAQNKHVVAIGECGLDYTEPPPWEKSRSKEDQFLLFEEQIKLSEKLNKSIIIHARNATDDMLWFLKNAKSKYSFNAVWHCFTEDYKTAATILDLGLMISLTGIITYPKSQELRETVAKIPLDRIMLETDSPYLVPHLARKGGQKVNTPAYVKMVAQEIADIQRKELADIIDITYKNAVLFFGC